MFSPSFAFGRTFLLQSGIAAPFLQSTPGIPDSLPAQTGSGAIFSVPSSSVSLDFSSTSRVYISDAPGA
jgi:hypothetical protein